MALTDENGSSPFTMPVQPMYGGGYGNGGFGGFGGDWGWIILLLLCANGGWGGFGGFGGMGGFGGAMWDFPWLINGQQGINNNVSDGFRSAQLSDGITSIRDGISGLSTQLCGCCGDLQMALANGFSGVEQGANARQMANMQQLFGIQSAQQQCCCDTRAGIADLRYTVATEACADRAAVGDALQAVTMQGVQNTNALMTTLRDGIQAIKDELCNDRLEAERRDNANLRAELMYARGQASQIDQTAQIKAGQAATMANLVNELRSCPIPAQPVAGNTPLFSCNPGFNNGGCGCNGNGFGFNG